MALRFQRITLKLFVVFLLLLFFVHSSFFVWSLVLIIRIMIK